MRTVIESDRLVARNIKRLRELHGMNRRELEEKAGIAYAILDQIEAFHKPAGKIIQKRIIEALNCPLSELYQEEFPKRIREPMAPYLTKKQKRLIEVGERLTEREFKEAMDFMAWLLAKRPTKGKAG